MHYLPRITLMLWMIVPAGWGQSWEKVELPETLLPELLLPGPGWYRLVANDQGGLFLRNGNSLLLGNPGGSHWKVSKPAAAQSGAFPFMSLAAGPEDVILWGNLRSRNGGQSWDSLGVFDRHTAFLVGSDGMCVAGTYDEVIERSTDTGRTWEKVHFWKPFRSHILQLVRADAKVYFASPQYGDLLVSRDAGMSWSEWAQDTIQSLHSPLQVDVMAMEAGTGGPTLLTIQNETRGGPGKSYLVRIPLISGAADTLAANLPDSAILCLQVASDGTRWIGTRGQGVFMSRDGVRWIAANKGLGNLVVDALAFSNGRTIFASTTDGLYRSTLPATGLFPSQGRQHARAQRGAPLLYIPGLSSRLPSSEESLILPDGRKVGSQPNNFIQPSMEIFK